jgi:ribosome biogenesis protein YTM1
MATSVVPATSSVGLPGDRASVMVSFFTTTCALHMPEQAYAIPVATLPTGLTALIHSVLELEGTPNAIPFDFLLDDEYITTSLDRFLRRRMINMEKILHVEYTPALQAEEGSKLPHDDWVSTVRAPTFGQSSLLLTGSFDHCVRLWSGEQCLAIGSFHKEAVKEVALSPVLPQPAASSSASLPGVGTKRKKQAAFESAAPFLFASASKDGAIAAWQFSDGKFTLLGSTQQHLASVDSVDISPVDGQLVASGSWDCTCKVFQWKSLTDASLGNKVPPLISFTDHARPVLSTRFSQSAPGRTLYSAGLDGNIKEWDLEKTQLAATLPGDHSIQRLAVKPSASGSSDLILTGNTDNRVRLYDPRARVPVVKVFTGHRQWCYGVAWLWRREQGSASAAGETAQSANHFVSVSEDATLRVWDLRCTSGSLLTLDHLHTDGILDVTYVGGNEIASGGKDNKTKTFMLERAAAVS